MKPNADALDAIRPFLRADRLLKTAVALVEVPSKTGEAKAVLDRLAELLRADGFAVERPTGGYDQAPAVAVRLDSGVPGRTLQFNGHLDTVHLPFVPPSVEGDLLRGSGASDMKAGLAAAVEALRALRDAGVLQAGSILLTAHDLHESPWGDGRQLDRMIGDGYVGDAVLLPEPLSEVLPIIGRGQAAWKAAIRRPGPPVHEVMRPPGEPSVISAAGFLVRELDALAEQLAAGASPGPPDLDPGKPSVFIGQVHAGEIYNQYPQVCYLEGTRRWLPGTDRHAVEAEFRAVLDRIAGVTRTTIDCRWNFTRDAFRLDVSDPFVSTFRETYEALAGNPLATGPKPFVDDGNSFWAAAGIPAITHGPRAGGQHTLDEWVSIADLSRVAALYAATALAYCRAT